MSIQVAVQGTLKPDGTLELDEPLPLPTGRVQVLVQPLVQPSPDDPFWKTMERIWADQKARGHVPRSDQEVEGPAVCLRSVRPVSLDRIPECLKPLGISVPVLHDQCRNALGVSLCR